MDSSRAILVFSPVEQERGQFDVGAVFHRWLGWQRMKGQGKMARSWRNDASQVCTLLTLSNVSVWSDGREGAETMGNDVRNFLCASRF